MTFSCLFSPHSKINTPLSQKATKYRWKIIHSDADDIVHYPQDPRSPGLPAFGPSWSLGWFLLPPWWASCAAWRTQRSTQHNTATISKKKGDVCAPWVWSCLSAAWVKAAARPSARRAPSGVCLQTRPWRCEPSDAADPESSAPLWTGSLGTWEGSAAVKKHHDQPDTTGIFEANVSAGGSKEPKNTLAEFDSILTRMWRKRARWWPWPRPQTWSWSSGSSRGRWLAPQVLPSSPLGPFRNTQDKRKRPWLIHSKVQFLSAAVHFLSFTSEDFALVIQQLLSLNAGLYKLFENTDWVILTLNTAAPQAQAPRVSLRGRLAAELIARQVAVEQAAKIHNTFYFTFL